MSKYTREVMTAIELFAAWYEEKPEEVQRLIDEVSNGTSFVIDEDEYDCFISELAKLGINDAAVFESRFIEELTGIGGHDEPADYELMLEFNGNSYLFYDQNHKHLN